VDKRTNYLTVQRHGVTLHFDASGFVDVPWVYQPLLHGKVYEEAFLQHIRAVGRGGQYIDVGAHLGTHTIWFAALCPATRVHAIEPVGRYADVIERNLAANQLGVPVIVHRVGASDRPGRASNHLGREHRLGFTEGDVRADEEFPVVRLDDLVRGEVGVIKLDVEGMESAVLGGATRILSRYRPVVYAESHDATAEARVARLLARFGYRRTGQVFNPSPTYEYAAPPRQGWERLRPMYARLPAEVQGTLRRNARFTQHRLP
jgi:FkbM family methyltransferase